MLILLTFFHGVAHSKLLSFLVSKLLKIKQWKMVNNNILFYKLKLPARHTIQNKMKTSETVQPFIYLFIFIRFFLSKWE